MSAVVAIQKFSFPFACAARLPQQDEVTQEGCAQVKALQGSPVLTKPSPVTAVGALVHNEKQLQESPKPPPAAAVAPVLVCAEAPRGAVLSRQSVSEKLTVESEDQRPAAKRQLSSESAAGTITVVKKSAVRKEADERRHPQQKAQPRGKAAAPRAAAAGKRKSRKDLFSSSEVFLRVDSHVIRAGAELKEKCVYDVKTIVQRITLGARNELEKLRAIWVWLCHNIEYDVSGYLGRSEKPSSAEEVIAAGRGVCCSYSNLCAEMCREVAIECQEVPGHSKGIGYRQGQSLKHVKSDHLWNAALLAGQWFLLDACWGAGRVDMERESFVKTFDDFYFLTDPEDFIDSHFPDEEKWQLLDTPVPLEEFERRVFKTSAFFALGLRLIQPRHCHIVTDDGEANVSLGFSRPTTFTYEITQHQDLLHRGAAEQESSSSSSGLLTVSRRSMKLQLLPPARGTYDVKVFARPEAATAPLIWVCSFTVECPTPRAMEEIPENPFMSWGLQPAAGSLGVVGSSLGSEAAEVDGGAFDLVLKTSRQLTVLCELVHPEVEAAVAKRCVATRIQPDVLTCHVLCPLRGFYRLSVFVRDYDKTDVKFQNAANFLLRCKGKVIGPDELFPPNLGSACGPGTRTSEAGLSKFSHTTAVVSTQQGKCNLTFHNQRDLELHSVLSKGDGKAALSRHLFCTYTDSKVTVSVSLPGAGVYRLGLYARLAPGADFNPMCDFVLRNSCDQTGPPFPCVFSAWRKGCVLFEPRVGLLEPLAWVRFRVRVPGAQRVSAVGETRADLKLNKSRVWEADVFTGNGPQQLKLAASSGESGDMAVLMTFDIKQREGGV